MSKFKIKKFPRTRIATIDVCEIGKNKHHISAMIEIDVTESREKIKLLRKESIKLSFTAWLIKAISITIKNHDYTAAYLKGRRKLVIFNDINISLLIEKEINEQKIPMPLLIEKANDLSVGAITKQIEDAQSKVISNNDIVLQRKTNLSQNIYFKLPGLIRRYLFKFLLKKPVRAYSKMGNVAITSIGMFGSINGWFIPISVHPICIGIGSIVKKPIVLNDQIEIREILNLSVLLDHDVIDGGNMARFIRELVKNVESGISL